MRTVLAERLDGVGGRRLIRLQRFDRDQILAFLTRRTGSVEEAMRRMELLDDVEDLMGLSENPRMLSFISELEREELEKARGAEGKVTSAALYRVLIEQWLKFEIARVEPEGAAPSLPLTERWNAVSVLARCLWEKPEPTIGLSEVGEKIAETIASLPHLDAASATHQVGSGTLLVRDPDGNFSFVHQSVLEWLVANNAATELQTGAIPRALTVKEMSRLMVDFFIDLAGSAAAEWAREVGSSLTPDPIAKKNAVNVLNRLPQEQAESDATLRVAGANLRAQDFSFQPLRNADFTGSDLSESRFINADLRAASMRNANLTDADLSHADLRDVDFTGANLTRARLMGADLRGAKFRGANLERARLIGAQFERAQLQDSRTFGAALAIDDTFQPVLDLAISALRLEWDWSGQYLYAAALGDITLYDLNRGQRLRSYPVADCLAVSVNHENTFLAAASRDGSVLFVNIETGASTVVASFEPGSLKAIRLAAETEPLMVATSEGIFEVDPIGRKVNPLLNYAEDLFAGQKVWSVSVEVAFSGDGRSAIVTNAHTFVLWTRGDAPRTLAENRGTPYISQFAAVFDPPAVVLAGVAKQILLLNEAEARLLASAGQYVQGVAITDSGTTVAYAQRDGVVLVDTKNLTPRAVHGTHGWSYHLSFDRTERFLAIGRTPGISVIETTHGGVVKEIGRGFQSILAVEAVSATRLTVLTSDGLKQWSVDTLDARIVMPYDSPAVLGAIDGASSTVVVADETSRVVAMVPSVDVVPFRVAVGLNAIALENGVVAYAEQDRLVTWDITERHTHEIDMTTKNVDAIAFQPGSDVLVAAVDYGTTRSRLMFLHARTAKKRYEHEIDGDVMHLSISRDGLIAVTGFAGMRLFRIHKRQLLSVFAEDHARGGTLTRDGKWLITLVGREVRVRQTARLDAPTVIRTSILPWRVATSPDEQTLFCASWNGAVDVIDLQRGKLLGTVAEVENGFVGYRPDGRYRVNGDAKNEFGHTIGLCRFDPGELDAFADLRIPEDEPFIRFPGAG